MTGASDMTETLDDPEADTRFEVVVNQEEQYSIWPADDHLPAGWRIVGVCGSKTECLDHIEQVWIDMRPRSLRDGTR
jgi:MbtH protein